MRSKYGRSTLYGTIVALALAGGAVGLPSVAAAAVDPAPIGPHQFFVGEVNGISTASSAAAVIKVGCFGPVTPGETGHPVAGQYVDVLPVAPPTTVDDGYTGESADHIVVDFGVPSSTGLPVTLTSYAVRAEIPTTLSLPCSGAGDVAFVPAPTSATARTALVKVTYENIGV